MNNYDNQDNGTNNNNVTLSGYEVNLDPEILADMQIYS